MSSPRSSSSDERARLSLRQGIGLAVGLVVGSGLLALPGLSLQSGIYVAAVAWVVIVASVIPLIEIFSTLALRYPTAEGLAYYANLALGPWARAGVTWVMAGCALIGLPALAMVGGGYLGRALGLPEADAGWIAAAILIAMSAVNLFEARASATLGLCSAGVLVCVALALVLTNLSFVPPAATAIRLAWTPGFPVDYGAIGRVTTLLFWAFLGWENLSSCTEQLRDPKRDIPWVYYASFALVTLLYLALALISLGAKAGGLAVERADGLALLARQGRLGGALVFGMAAVILSNANSWIFGCSRFLQASGREGSLPGVFARVNARGAPAHAVGILLAGNLAVLSLLLWRVCSISDLMVFVDQAYIVIYAIAIVAYFKSQTGWKRWGVSACALFPFAVLSLSFNFLACVPLGLLASSWLLRSRARTPALARRAASLSRPRRRRLLLRRPPKEKDEATAAR